MGIWSKDYQTLQRILANMKKSSPKEYQKLKDARAIMDQKPPRVLTEQPLSAKNKRLSDRWVGRKVDAQAGMRRYLLNETMLGPSRVGQFMADFGMLARKGMLPTVLAAPAAADQVRRQSSSKAKKKT